MKVDDNAPTRAPMGRGWHDPRCPACASNRRLTRCLGNAKARKCKSAK